MTVRHTTKFLQGSLSHKNQKPLLCPGKQEHLFLEINPALLVRPQGEGDVIPMDLSAASRVFAPPVPMHPGPGHCGEGRRKEAVGVGGWEESGEVL